MNKRRTQQNERWELLVVALPRPLYIKVRIFFCETPSKSATRWLELNFFYWDYAFNSILRFPSRCILAQPNMHFIVPCRGDRRAAVTHSSKSFCLSSLCKYRAGISARPSTKEWIKVIECYQETLGFGIEKWLFFLSSADFAHQVLVWSAAVRTPQYSSFWG